MTEAREGACARDIIMEGIGNLVGDAKRRFGVVEISPEETTEGELLERFVHRDAWSQRGLMVGAPLNLRQNSRYIRHGESSMTRNVKPLGVYVHFPWCLKKCPYCDFVSFAKKRDEIDHAAYSDAVLREIEARKGALETTSVETIFFGGGTPSLWEPEELGRVLDALLSMNRITDVEVTLECNPTSLDPDRAKAYCDAGINRFSIGTQSLDAKELSYLGRLHDASLAEAAIDGALATGARVSSDLIFGLPDQPLERAVEHAERLAAHGITHLSCYQLTIEPGTQFGELAKIGRLPLADDGRVAQSFLAIDEALEKKGFSHYEISNYAKPGDESRHNLGYWRGRDYLGIGTAAVGRIGNVRYRNEPDPARYAARTKTMKPGLFGEEDGLSTFEETLDAETLLRERIMLGLRLKEGFDLESDAQELGVEALSKERARELEKLLTKGRVWKKGARIGMTREGWLFANDVAARLF